VGRHTHAFNGPFSGTTQVSRYQKGKNNLDFTEARDSEWQWHQLSHMQVCTSLQTDNHASTTPLKVFYRPDALPAAQPTASKHCGGKTSLVNLMKQMQRGKRMGESIMGDREGKGKGSAAASAPTFQPWLHLCPATTDIKSAGPTGICNQ